MPLMTVNGRRVFCWPLTATHFLLALPCPKQQSIVGTKQSNGRMVIDSHQHGRFGGGGGTWDMAGGVQEATKFMENMW